MSRGKNLKNRFSDDASSFLDVCKYLLFTTDTASSTMSESTVESFIKSAPVQLYKSDIADFWRLYLYRYLIINTALLLNNKIDISNVKKVPLPLRF